MRAAGQLRDQPALDRAEGEPPVLLRLRDRIDIIEHPAHLRGGEIRVDQQAGLLVNRLLMALIAQGSAGIGGAPVLPYDRAGEWLQRLAVPCDYRLALVGDPDRCNAFGRAVAQHPACTIEGRLPDFLRIVLDPAGLREMLRDLGLRGPCNRAVAPEQDRAGRGGSGVDHQDMFAQG